MLVEVNSNSEGDGRGGSDRDAPSTRLMELGMEGRGEMVSLCCEKGGQHIRDSRN
jgi:hypothetical protein